ncbi:MAG: hypothetical protein JOZ55_00760 [Alphaproteobacteria bacterium]|nr:hypothetical protein [Alphaproteobacteria bacterium]
MSDLVAPAPVASRHFVDWRAIFAGAVLAAAVSITLLAFGSAIGLSVASTAPTWRDSSAFLWLLSGLFLVFVALCGFGFGGYAAGRMRPAAGVTGNVETEFGDGMHGLFVWAVAVLFSALLAFAGAATVSRAVAPSGGSAGPAASVAGENTIASELDELFRTDRVSTEGNIEYNRSEAARILLKSSGHNGVPADDRDYLAAVVSNRAHISDAEAADRVNRAIGESADELHRARVAAVLQAFMAGAALLLGAAIASYAAIEGGRDREHRTIPVWDWSFRRRRP